MDVQTVLKQKAFTDMISLFSEETNWTRQKYARDATGNETDPLGSQAVSWCLGGAIKRIIPNNIELQNECVEIMIKSIRSQAGSHFMSISSFNDNHETGFPDIQNMLRGCLKIIEKI